MPRSIRIFRDIQLHILNLTKNIVIDKIISRMSLQKNIDFLT